MRVHAVAPASEHELETEEGEPAELLRWQLLSVGEEEASRALLVAEGYGVVDNTAVLGTPPLTDGASIAVLNRDGQPFARPAGAAAADSGTEAPRLADVLEHAPRQLEAALTELSAQSTDMAAGLREMSDAVNAGIAATWRYEESHVRAAALKTIPLASLLRRARERHPDLPRDEAVLRALLRWFKHQFFRWVNSPSCEGCGGGTKCIGAARPTPAERQGLAGVTEVYQCNACGALTRFPRYNEPATLLRTRRGRCGEWANAFTCCCRAAGFSARHVRDWTDHVWTEVYLHSRRRWVHADPCECALDAPLMYEQGWGKKLTYVIAFAADHAVDVTRRYTRRLADVAARRAKAPEDALANCLLLATARAARKRGCDDDAISALLAAEEADLRSSARGRSSLRSAETRGRTSGAAAWIQSRGEDGRESQPSGWQSASVHRAALGWCPTDGVCPAAARDVLSGVGSCLLATPPGLAVVSVHSPGTLVIRTARDGSSVQTQLPAADVQSAALCPVPAAAAAAASGMEAEPAKRAVWLLVACCCATEGDSEAGGTLTTFALACIRWEGSEPSACVMRSSSARSDGPVASLSAAAGAGEGGPRVVALVAGGGAVSELPLSNLFSGSSAGEAGTAPSLRTWRDVTPSPSGLQALVPPLGGVLSRTLLAVDSAGQLRAHGDPARLRDAWSPGKRGHAASGARITAPAALALRGGSEAGDATVTFAGVPDPDSDAWRALVGERGGLDLVLAPASAGDVAYGSDTALIKLRKEAVAEGRVQWPARLLPRDSGLHVFLLRVRGSATVLCRSKPVAVADAAPIVDVHVGFEGAGFSDSCPDRWERDGRDLLARTRPTRAHLYLRRRAADSEPAVTDVFVDASPTPVSPHDAVLRRRPLGDADATLYLHVVREPRAQHRPVCDVHAVWLHAGEAVPATADKISVPLVRRAPWGGDVRLCTGHAPEGWVRLGALDGALPPLAASNGSLFALGAVEEEEEEGKRVDLTEGTRETAPDRARSAVLRAPLHVSLLPAAWAEPARDPALRGRALFFMLTRGCGRTPCPNAHCASNPEVDGLSPTAAARRLLLLARDPAVAICPAAAALVVPSPGR